MTIRPFVFGLSLLLVSALGVSVGLALSTPAQAQTQASRTAVCQPKFGVGASAINESLQTWMNEQLTAGRTQFVTVPLAGTLSTVCAW